MDFITFVVLIQLYFLCEFSVLRFFKFLFLFLHVYRPLSAEPCQVEGRKKLGIEEFFFYLHDLFYVF